MGQRRAIKRGKELPVVLLTFALGCGGRSGLDLFGEPSAASSGSASGVGPSGPPSCAPGGDGMTNCGANSESCCASLEVTGGTYYRTYTNSGSGPTGEADPATVSGFRLDKYDVTVGRFRQFVNAWNGGWLPAEGSGKHTYLNGGMGLANSGSPGTYEPGWAASDNSKIDPTDANLTNSATCGVYATWTATAGSQENLPINCVSWWDSYAFCIWDGGFLPSEAEWEYAAAGGSQQREYAWGSADPGTSNQYAIFGALYPSGFQSCTGAACLAPVGTATLGGGLWGQLDLVGDVIEWELDSYSSYVDPCVDCAYLTGTSGHVNRGSSFDGSLDMSSLRSSIVNASDIGPEIGLRCARAP